MNPTSIQPSNATLLAVLTLCGAVLAAPAQTKSKAASGEPGKVVTDDSGRARFSVVEIKVGDLRNVVEQLQAQIEAAAGERLNILFGQDVEGWPVPTLKLSNVSGPEALQLIAVAAGAELEPIHAGKEPWSYSGPRVIGYRLLNPHLSTAPGMSGYGGGAMTPPSGAVRSGPPSRGSWPVPAAPKAPQAPKPPQSPGALGAGGPGLGAPGGFDPADAVPGAAGGDPFGSDFGGGGSGFGGVGPGSGGGSGFGGSFPGAGVAGFGPAMGSIGGDVKLTRVYPLSTITTQIEFTELEETLMEVLAADGIEPDAAKIAVHEKTNVLVVRAAENVHFLVDQLLESLTKNVTEGQAAARTGELRQLHVQIESEAFKRQRLEEALKRAQDEASNLQRQLRELQGKVSPKP
jgi:hypothetical protein